MAALEGHISPFRAFGLKRAMIFFIACTVLSMYRSYAFILYVPRALSISAPLFLYISRLWRHSYLTHGQRSFEHNISFSSTSS